MQVSDVITLLTLMLSIVGAVVAIKQWRETVRVRRAEFVKSLYDEFSHNDRVRSGVYLLDYEQDWYDEMFHEEQGEGSRQVIIDVTLSYLSYICYLHKTHILTNEEFRLFRYEIERAIRNASLQDYLYNLYHFSDSQGTEFPFPDLLGHAQKSQMLPAAFYDNTVCDKAQQRFHHILNF